MKYVQPYGISDPDAPYINGDPSIARQGSIPPAEAFEHPMRELVAVISNSVITPSAADLEQLTKAVRSQRLNYAQDTGSLNTLSVALDPPVASYTIGLPLRVKVANTNSGASTIDAGAGRVQIKKPNGTQVSSGDLPQNGLIDLVYDGTAFQMINFGGAGAGGGTEVFVVNIPYTVETSQSGTANPNLIIADFSFPETLTSIAAGMIFMVKRIYTNAGPANIRVNGLGPFPVKALGVRVENADLLPSDIVTGDVCLYMYDGTQFWLTPNNTINANTTLNVANNADLNNLLMRLSRKRINSDVTLTIKLATGIWGRIDTYHTDAERIVVEGTMLAANPTFTDFHKTGNTPAARANDSANNLAMLRTRYGTELRFDNTVSGQALSHHGPGAITFKNILVVGNNVNAGTAAGAIYAVGPQNGQHIQCVGVSVSQSGGYGFVVSGGGRMDLSSCFATGCHIDGFLSFDSSNVICYTCGSYGNGGIGMSAGVGATLFCFARRGAAGFPDVLGSQSQFNGGAGITATNAAIAVINWSQVVGNSLPDLYVANAGYITIGGPDNTYATTTPAVGIEGNLGSWILLS